MSSKVRATPASGEPTRFRSDRASVPGGADRLDAVELLREAWGFGARYVPDSSPLRDDMSAAPVTVGFGPVPA